MKQSTTMTLTGVLFLASVVAAGGGFSPTFTISCTTDSIVIAITGSASTGQVYIDGACAAQATTVSSSSHTFNAAACAGGFPAIDSTFTVVIQEFAAIDQASDSVTTATCKKDLTQQSVTLAGGVGVTPNTVDGSTTASLAPTFTIALVDTNDATITAGTVGTSVTLKVTMTAAYQSLFDFKINSITANAVSVVTAGCAAYSSLSNPDLISATGVVTWAFSLFIPVTGNTRSGTAVTLTITLDICDGTCTANTCGVRRRRSISGTNSSSSTLSTTVFVYPEEFLKDIGLLTNHLVDKEDDLCIPQTSMVAILVGLAVALAICLVMTSIMFVKLRNRQRKHDKEVFGMPNAAYRK